MVDYDKYKERIFEIEKRIYNDGYNEGYDAAKQKYGRDKSGSTIVHAATTEQIEGWGRELVGWCESCSKAIEGRWVGWAHYCPWCGKVIDWDRSEVEKQYSSIYGNLEKMYLHRAGRAVTVYCKNIKQAKEARDAIDKFVVSVMNQDFKGGAENE